MSGSTPIDKTRDPLIGELLPMMQAAANARVSEYLAAATLPDEVAIRTVSADPFFVKTMPSTDEMPALACFISKSQRRYSTLVYLDHYATLTFQYVTPMTAFEDLSARWPILHLVWRAITDTLHDGFSAAWQSGARTLDDAGLVRADLESARYDAVYARGGDYAFPMFTGTVDVVWRDLANWRFGERGAVPLEYVRANLYTESDPATGIAPDVVTQTDGVPPDPLTSEADA